MKKIKFLLVSTILFCCDYTIKIKNMLASIKLNDNMINNINKKKNQNTFRKPIRDIKFSTKGASLLVKYLEGSKFNDRTAFLGCGGYLSFGAEYVLRPNDLKNKGLFAKSGLKIEDYLSKQFIQYLINQNYSKYIKINKNEIIEWKNKNGFIKELSKKDAIKLFKTFIYEDIKQLNKIINVSLSQNEFDAIICALYNFGLPYLARIKFFETLNDGNRIKAAFILSSAREDRLKKSNNIYNYDNYKSCTERWNNGNISNKELIKLANESLSPQKFIYGWTKRDFIQFNMFMNNSFSNYQSSPNIQVEKYLKNIFISNNNILKLLKLNGIIKNIPNTIFSQISRYTNFLNLIVEPFYTNITNKFWYALKEGKHKSWIFTGDKGIEKLTKQYLNHTNDKGISIPKQNIGPFILSLQSANLNKDEEYLIKNHLMIGGIILFKRNIKNKEKLKLLIQNIKHIRPEILILIDEEGGFIQRTTVKGFQKWPAAKSYGDAYNINREFGLEFAYRNGFAIGHLLKELNIDVNLAPVIDLDIPNSLITDWSRSFHKNPKIVYEIAQKFIEGHKRNNISCVAKHFPGHSSVTGDIHNNVITSNLSLNELEQSHIYPFIECIKNKSIDAIMPSHIIFNKVDSLPVSLSKKWLYNIIRQQYKFNGPIISDCLSMEGANICTLEDRAFKALNAGCDMIIICNQELQKILYLLSKFNINFDYVQSLDSLKRIQLLNNKLRIANKI